MDDLHYLNFLQSRVKCYFKRLQEEEAWKKYCTSRVRSPNISHQESYFKDIKRELHKKENNPFQVPQNPKREVSHVFSKNKFQKPVNSMLTNEVQPDNIGSETHSRSVHSKPCLHKEFIIKTPQIQNELKKAVVATTVSHRIASEPTYHNHTSRNCLSRKDFKAPNIYKNVPTFPTEIIGSVAKSPEKSIKKEHFHQFQVPSTILFLESFVWDRILQDTVDEMERIAVNESKKKKELLLIKYRKHLSDLQHRAQTISKEKIKESEEPEALEGYSKNPSKVQSTSKSSSSSSATSNLTAKSHPTKADPIMLKMSEESVQSIHSSLSKFQSYNQKSWPPLSGIEDFHHSTIQISDSLLEDALNEIIVEVEQISNHIIHSCFVQEIGNF